MPNKNYAKAMRRGKGGGSMGSSHSRSLGEVTRASPSKSHGSLGGAEYCRTLGEVTRATPSKRQ